MLFWLPLLFSIVSPCAAACNSAWWSTPFSGPILCNYRFKKIDGAFVPRIFLLSCERKRFHDCYSFYYLLSMKVIFLLMIILGSLCAFSLEPCFRSYQCSTVSKYQWPLKRKLRQDRREKQKKTLERHYFLIKKGGGKFYFVPVLRNKTTTAFCIFLVLPQFCNIIIVFLEKTQALYITIVMYFSMKIGTPISN